MTISKMYHRLIHALPVLSLTATTLVVTCLFARQEAAIPPPSTAAQLYPIPAAEISGQAERSRAFVRDLLLLLQNQTGIKEIESHLPEAAQRLEEAALETGAMLAARPSRDVLEEFQSQWNGELSRLKKLREQVEGYTNRLNPLLAQLQAQVALWRLTAREAPGSKMPAPLVERANATLKAIEDADRQASEQQGELLGVQGQLGKLQAACEHNLDEISAAARGSLFSFDSPPLWTALLQVEPRTESTVRIRETLEKQIATLARYLKSESRRVVAQVALFCAVLFILSLLKRRARRWENDEKFSSTAARVLGRPASAALLITLALTGMFHPHCPPRAPEPGLPSGRSPAAEASAGPLPDPGSSCHLLAGLFLPRGPRHRGHFLSHARRSIAAAFACFSALGGAGGRDQNHKTQG